MVNKLNINNIFDKYVFAKNKVCNYNITVLRDKYQLNHTKDLLAICSGHLGHRRTPPPSARAAKEGLAWCLLLAAGPGQGRWAVGGQEAPKTGVPLHAASRIRGLEASGGAPAGCRGAASPSERLG